MRRGPQTAEQIAKVVKATKATGDSIQRLLACGLVTKRNNIFMAIEKQAMSQFIDVSDDPEDEDNDELKKLTLEVLKNGKPGVILNFWKKAFESALGRTCTIRQSGVTYGKIASALKLLNTSADLIVLLEFALEKRAKDESLIPGWSVADPTIGFFSSGDRVQAVLSQLMDSEYWAKRRAQYNLYAAGSIERMRKKFSVSEFEVLKKYLCI